MTDKLLHHQKLVELFQLNDEFLKRLICAHYPFSNEFIEKNMLSLKWGSPVYTTTERFDTMLLISEPKYGLCFNNNIEKKVFHFENIPFETQHFTSYDWTGFHGQDEMPLSTLHEFENFYKKFYEFNGHKSTWDYYPDLDERTPDELSMVEREMEHWTNLLIDVKLARTKDFKIKSLEDCHALVSNIEPIFALNVNLFAAVKVFLDNNFDNWLEIIFDINYGAEELFNACFQLINSKSISEQFESNFFRDFNDNPLQLLSLKYEYQAKCVDDYSKAVKLLDFFLSLFPKDRIALSLRGLAKYRLNNFIEALNDLESTLVIDPEFVFALNIMGILKLKRCEDNVAYELFTKAINHYQGSAKLFLNRGQANIALKDFRAAIEDITRAIEINKKYANAYFIRAVANYALLNFHNAQNDFVRAFVLDNSLTEEFNKREYMQNCFPFDQMDSQFDQTSDRLSNYNIFHLDETDWSHYNDDLDMDQQSDEFWNQF